MVLDCMYSEPSFRFRFVARIAAEGVTTLPEGYHSIFKLWKFLKSKLTWPHMLHPRYNSHQWTHCQSVVTQGTAEEESRDKAGEEERQGKNGRAER